MLAPGTVLSERWTIEEELRSGGQAWLFRARDALGGGPVVVKLAYAKDDEEEARAQRERVALELLRFPGVVTLRGSGVHGGRSFLVMEQVEGAPFPGRPGPVPWAELVPLLSRLLGVLAQVHAAGVVHRDLSAANVLVRPDGSVVVLDFGLARGQPLGAPLTEARDVLGTVECVPPEVLLDRQEPGISADVFAVGVLAWHAATGEHPWPAAVQGRLDAFRARRPPTWVGPANPEATRWANLMLAFDPGERPATAGEALQALHIGRRPDPLPYLGPTTQLERALSLLKDGQPVRVAGPRGSGRTRFLQELERRLGHTRWLCPSDRPFGSLIAAGYPEPPVSNDLDQTCDWFAAILDWAEVVLVDDPERIDPQTSRLLTSLTRGRVVRVVRPGEAADITMESIPPDALRSLFVGRERLVGLRSGPAAELHRRTGGSARAISLELAAWEQAGLARKTGEGWSVDRRSWDHLRAAGRVARMPGAVGANVNAEQAELLAWVALAEPHARRSLLVAATSKPAWVVQSMCEELAARGELGFEQDLMRDRTCGATLARWDAARRRAAHARLADHLPVDTPDRVFHALMGESPRAVALTVDTAEHILARGNTRLAALLLAACARWPHAAITPQDRARLDRAWLLAAFSTEDQAALHEVREGLGDRVPVLVALAAAAIECRAGEPARAFGALDAMGPLDDADLESWRRSWLAQAAQRCAPGQFQAIVDDAREWAETVGDDAILGRAWLLSGWADYYQERYAEAEDWFVRAVAVRTRGDLRVSTLLALASARVEAGRWDAARAAAVEARDLAWRSGLRVYVARAEWLLRRADVRSGVATAVDEELVEAAGELGDRTMEGLICMTEAGVALRVDPPRARTLAQRAWAGLGQQAAGLTAAAVVIAAGGRPEPAPVWTHELPPMIRLQIRALGGQAGEDDLAVLTAGRDPDLRLDVLTLQECLARLGAAPRSGGDDPAAS